MPLTPAKRIDPPAWMKDAEVEKIMSVLGANEGRARFVGGCVRNHMLGLAVRDIDIAAAAMPQDITKKLQEAGIKAVPTGIAYGTVTAVIGGKSFEITSLRKDVETDGRRAVVAYTDDWREDAQRRDFTINTLLADLEGNIYDPTGQGLADLEKRRVIFVGDPAARIAEDYLRILRFFRFHAWYGQGEPDPAALQACRAAGDKIALLSLERISQEWFKIISVDDPVNILKILNQNKILENFFESNYKPDMLERICVLQIRHEAFSLSSRLLLLGGFNKNFFDKKVILFKGIRRDLESISQALLLLASVSDHQVRTAVYKTGREASVQALLIKAARGQIQTDFLSKALEIARLWNIPKPPVTGEDLKKAGMKEGPEMGQKLKDIEQWWIDQDFNPSRAECLAKI